MLLVARLVFRGSRRGAEQPTTKGVVLHFFAFFRDAACFLPAAWLAVAFFAPLLPLKIVSQPAEYFFVEPTCVTVTAEYPFSIGPMIFDQRTVNVFAACRSSGS
jgi:hypothetical protein